MATVKTCFKCLEEKSLSEFYVHSMMADGHLNKCKACAKADVAANRVANIERIQLYDRRRGALPHRRARNRVRSAAWRAAFPRRRAAQVAVGAAIKSGVLKRQLCLVCGEKAEAHHPDYERPLDVVWLCSPHHKQTHALLKKAA
jgi:hypothetical protein